jgi:hypothetical protein
VGVRGFFLGEGEGVSVLLDFRLGGGLGVKVELIADCGDV